MKLLSLLSEEQKEADSGQVERCVAEILQRSDFKADMERRMTALIQVLVINNQDDGDVSI